MQRDTPGALARRLERGLDAVYTVCGEEPFLVEEAAAAIRSAARAAGFEEREVFHAERGFDWSALASAAASLSLFASKRIIELRLPSAKPGDAGARALADYCARPADDTILLVIAGKLDGNTRKSKWVSTLRDAGPLQEFRPLGLTELNRWLVARMRACGLQPHPDAVDLLVQRVEGNLLAAAQEVDKLALLQGAGPITVDAVREAVADSARYDLFQWVDAAVAGESARALRMLDGMRAEGAEPVLVLWALVRELRTLASVTAAVGRGEPLDRALYAARVWQARQSLVRNAIGRMRPARVARLLRRAAGVDRVIKGAAPGVAWDELSYLTVGLAGRQRAT
ncbi:MAG: DNA polymerase III subunit delta [Gammaproteobacteria bacterium]